MQTKSKMVFEKSLQTRQRIFEVALEQMKEQGYQGATIRGICRKAGVSPATFYSYYDTKIDILMEFYSVSDRFFQEELPKRIAGLPFLEQLRIYVHEYAILNVNTGLDAMRVLYNPTNEWFAKPRPMQQTLVQILKVGVQEGVLSKDTDILDWVKTLFITLRGVCFDWCVCNGNYNLLEKMLLQAEILTRGLLVDPEAGLQLVNFRR